MDEKVEILGTSAEELELQSEELLRSPPPVAETVSQTFDRVASIWIDQHLRGSPLAGATQAWNHVMWKLDDLRDALAKELQPQSKE